MDWLQTTIVLVATVLADKTTNDLILFSGKTDVKEFFWRYWCGCEQVSGFETTTTEAMIMVQYNRQIRVIGGPVNNIAQRAQLFTGIVTWALFMILGLNFFFGL